MKPNIRIAKPRHDRVGEILSVGDYLLVNYVRRKVVNLHPCVVILPRDGHYEPLIVEPEKWRKAS